MSKFEVRRTVTTVVEAQSATDALKAALDLEDWSLADVTIHPMPPSPDDWLERARAAADYSDKNAP